MSDDYPVPGEDEYSFVDILIGRLSVMREASGTVDDHEVAAKLTPVEVDNGIQYRVQVSVAYGRFHDSMHRYYSSRGDADRAFDWLVERHGLEELEARRR